VRHDSCRPCRQHLHDPVDPVQAHTSQGRQHVPVAPLLHKSGAVWALRSVHCGAAE